MHDELWITALFNKYLAGVANTLLSVVRLHAEDPARPWGNFVTMQFLVVFIFIGVFAYLRPRLSADRPGRMQHVFEIVYGFLREQTDDVVGHGGTRYLHFFGTIFLFILFCNLIGLVPSLESPTMFTPVPLGCALAVFIYYNIVGLRAVGGVGYAKHFMGPVWWLAPLMIPIEIFSHLARLLSLTIRLVRQHVRGRAGDAGVHEPGPAWSAGHLHGLARFRGVFAGFRFHPAHDELRLRSGVARTLIPALCRFQCEPGCKRMTGTTSWERNHS